MLRVCERFGISPNAMDELRPGLWTLLIDYETVRESQEMAMEKARAGI